MSSVSLPIDVITSLRSSIFYSFRAVDALYDAAGQPGLGTINNHRVLIFSGSAVNTTYFSHVIIPQYTFDNINVDVFWSGTVGGENIITQLAFESVVLNDQDIDNDSFSTAKTMVHATPPASDRILRTITTFTRAEADSLSPNTPYRLRLNRNGNTDSDNNNWNVHHVVVRI